MNIPDSLQLPEDSPPGLYWTDLGGLLTRGTPKRLYACPFNDLWGIERPPGPVVVTIQGTLYTNGTTSAERQLYDEIANLYATNSIAVPGLGTRTFLAVQDITPRAVGLRRYDLTVQIVLGTAADINLEIINERPEGTNREIREDVSLELREDGGIELRER